MKGENYFLLNSFPLSWVQSTAVWFLLSAHTVYASLLASKQEASQRGLNCAFSADERIRKES